MIVYKQGNVLDSQASVIAHCVNCQGKMGRGVAAQIKVKWPVVWDSYNVQCGMTYNKDLLIGMCQAVQIGDEQYIANLFGQIDYGTHKRQLNYEYLYLSLENLINFMINKGLKSVAFPDMIGCGLAGGIREIVLTMIEVLFEDFEVEIWKYEQIN